MTEAELLKLTTAVSKLEVDLGMAHEEARKILKWLREQWGKEYGK